MRRVRFVLYAITLLPASVAAAEREASIFFINGVCETADKSEDSAALLASVLQADLNIPSENMNALLPTTALPNSSFKESNGALKGCLGDIFEAATQSVASGGLGFSPREFWGAFLSGDDSELTMQLLAGVAQGIASSIHLDLAEADLSHQLTAYEEALRSAPVIAVAHSQGNFFANEIFDRLSVLQRPHAGTVAVATPASSVAGEGPHWTSTNDFIYLVPGAMGPNTVAGFCLFPWTCHLFPNYLEKASLSRGAIVDSIRHFVETLPRPPDVVSGLRPANTPYAIDDQTDELVTFDIVALIKQVVGPLGFTDVAGLAFDSVTGKLYGVDNHTGQLIHISLLTGSGEAVGPLHLGDASSPANYIGDRIEDLAFGPGSLLLGVSSAADGRGRVVRIDTGSGQAQPILVTDGPLHLTGLAFHEQTKQVIAISEDGDIFEVDLVGRVLRPLGQLSVVVRDLTNDPRFKWPEVYALMQGEEGDQVGGFGFAEDIFSYTLFPPLGPERSMSALEYARYPNCAGVGIVDQEQEYLGGVCTGSWGILTRARHGQSFIPTLSEVTAVELYLNALNRPNTDTVTVKLREGGIDGQVLGETSRVVTQLPDDRMWQRFTFASPVAVTPGQPYVIEIGVTNNSFAWGIKQGSGVCDYPRGTALIDGSAWPGDRIFATCGRPEH